MDANRPNDVTNFRNHRGWLNGGGMAQCNSPLLTCWLKQKVIHTLSPRTTDVDVSPIAFPNISGVGLERTNARECH